MFIKLDSMMSERAAQSCSETATGASRECSASSSSKKQLQTVVMRQSGGLTIPRNFLLVLRSLCPVNAAVSEHPTLSNRSRWKNSQRTGSLKLE